ncbi:nucleolar protein 16 [Dermacentor andersoni]|uniref:nucleolar protein 16 n=1 Tax=Dermacentor andersoni TaxID=34620 RepID=UPI0021558841|nr:nucleolar protein 16-like [Dermacentor andersoni]
MGNAKKTKRRHRQTYSANHKKKMKKKLKRQVKIKSTLIKQAWEENKGIFDNLRDMGIAADANKAIPMEVDAQPATKGKRKTRAPKEHVVAQLEAAASEPRPSTLRMSQDDVKFCVYMLEKYGEDYAAMARDRKNHFQDTPAQIRQKINTLKKIPEQWNAYMRAKELA